MTRTVSLLADLLETILQENKDILTELNVFSVISSFRKDNPVLKGLSVDAGLKVDAGGLQEDPGVAAAIGALIFRIREYLEIFQGAPDADMRIGRAVADFRKRVGEDAVSELAVLFPEMLGAAQASPEKDIESLDELGKARRIFMQIFASAAGDAATKKALAEGLKAAPSVKSASDDLAQLEFNKGVWVGEAVSDLSVVVEKAGMDPEAVADILAEYGSVPDELGLTAGLFGGALAKTIRFGCGPLDSLLRDGIGRDESMVLEGPAGVEKDILAQLFAARALAIGGCAIVVATGCSVECVKQGLQVVGADTDKAEAESRLIFVDWHARHVERVTSIDADGNVIKVSNDLTNLAVGIDMALKRAAGHTQVRLVMDVASPTVVTEGFDRVHDFLNSVRAKMKNAGCAGLVLLNQDMHPQDQLGMLEDIFDGTMRIERTVEMGKVVSTLRVAALTGRAFSKSRLTLSMTGRGLAITGGEGESRDETVPFDCEAEKETMGLPGIESLSPGGLPVGTSFLVWMPSTIMPVDFVRPVVMEAQREGHGILLALSSIDSESVGAWMSEVGLSAKGLIDRGLLQIVDWYGRKSAKVLGMETDEGIIRTSKDLTHLGVGMDLALRKISDKDSSLAVLEFLSPALRLFDLKAVYAFAQSVNAKLARRGFTAFVLMERGAHDQAVSAALEELFDGIIDIKAAGTGLEICLVSIRGCHFQPEYRSLNKVRDRLTVDVSRNISDAEIAESLAQQGMGKRIKDLETQLEDVAAERAELERRVKEMAAKESEYEMRHKEMEETLAQARERLKDVPAGLPPDAEHRKEMAEFLEIMDRMLENLPPDVIESFAKSEEFKLYEKILGIYLEGKH